MVLTKQIIRQKLNIIQKYTNVCPNHCHLSQLLQSCSKNQHSHGMKLVGIILGQRQKWQHMKLIYSERIKERLELNL